MKILGLQKLTLLDYPGHLGAVLFVGGCNFRCPFCQNGPLVCAPETIPAYDMDEVRAFLRKRQGILEGICVTGGEPTLYRELPELLEEIRGLGYLVKLDTNGTNPDMLEMLLAESRLDYVAMDIKAGRANYARVAGLDAANGIGNSVKTVPGAAFSKCADAEAEQLLQPEVSKTPVSDITKPCARLMEKINRSVQLLLHCGIDYEFRTTVVGGLHTEEDFYDIADWLAGDSRYYLQSFRDGENIVLQDHPFFTFAETQMKQFLAIVQRKLPNAGLRGI